MDCAPMPGHRLAPPGDGTCALAGAERSALLELLPRQMRLDLCRRSFHLVLDEERRRAEGCHTARRCAQPIMRGRVGFGQQRRRRDPRSAAPASTASPRCRGPRPMRRRRAWWWDQGAARVPHPVRQDALGDAHAHRAQRSRRLIGRNATAAVLRGPAQQIAPSTRLRADPTAVGCRSRRRRQKEGRQTNSASCLAAIASFA